MAERIPRRTPPIKAGFGAMFAPERFVHAVDGVSFDIDKGEILGLIGPNGAGKSTVFNCIAGVYPPTSGKILFKGGEITGQKPWDISRKRIARTFQLVKPFASKTVLYNVMVGTFSQTKSTAEAEEKALKVLERLHLDHRKDTLAGSLTIADRKRLELARALATEPELLLLDGLVLDIGEIHSSLDPVARVFQIPDKDVFEQERPEISDVRPLIDRGPTVEKGDNLRIDRLEGLTFFPERIEQPDCASGCLFDGFPRTLQQAKALDKALRERGRSIARQYTSKCLMRS
jgi:ABC-type branched-subunit amino acid transport system ATPase component